MFFSVHELGWKTWARQLEAHSSSALENAIHVPLATPFHIRLLARPLPWPIRRPMLSERAYYMRTIKSHLNRITATQKIGIITVSSQRLAPCLLDFCKKEEVPLAICLDTTGPAYVRDLLHQQIPPSQTWDEEKKIYEFADLLIPWSNWARTSLIEEFHIPPEKIALTPPGIACNSTPRTAPNNKLPKILFVGNDWQRKGGPRLIQWHQTHFKDKAELHIASAKAPRQNLSNITFHGAVPHAQLLADLLPQMDLFCLPTLHDMSPFAIAEAQSAGLPVVSTKLAGIPDLVKHNESGYLLPANDDEGFIKALDNLITLPQLRQQMSINARNHAQNFLDASIIFPRLMNRLAQLQIQQQPVLNLQ